MPTPKGGLDHWQTVQTMLRGYRAAHVLITCAQLGLFDHLAGGSLDADTLARRSNTEPTSLTRLLNTAVSEKLLQKTGNKYANSPIAESCLIKGSPYPLGHLVRREGAFYQRWGYLTEAVRTGQRPEANIRDESSSNWVLDFELALYDLAKVYGPPIAEALALPPNRPVRVLDVGGGHGGYSMALARRYPNVQATVYELPAAAAVARDLITAADMTDRISVQEGDFQREPLGRGYDYLLLFGVLVSETPAQKIELLKKSHEALKPNGRVVIRGFWLNEDRTGPPPGPLFSLHMLLSTGAGDISTLNEMTGWLSEAGFVNERLLPLPEWVGSKLLIAEKIE